MRWIATVTYRHDVGPVIYRHEFDEMHYLVDLVERGPHWGTIMSILIVYAGAEAGITVEEAAGV